MAAIAWAPPILKSRVTPAARAAAITTGAGRGQATMISRTPGRSRGNRRHQQRRGQGIPSARNVAADAIERRDALLDRHSGRGLHPPALRSLPARDPLDLLLAAAAMAARTFGGTRTASSSISSRETSRSPSTLSKRFAYASSAASPRARTAETILRDGRGYPAIAAGRRRRAAARRP